MNITDRAKKVIILFVALNKNQDQLIQVLNIGINGRNIDDTFIKNMDWNQLLDEACHHGVKGLVWETIQKSPDVAATLPIEGKMVRFGQMRATEAEQHKKWMIAEQYAKAIAPYKCIVLKGIDYARYWPNPLRREYGDLDHWSGKDFDAVNIKASEKGAVVGDNGYKHTHTTYKGLTIENHEYLTEFGGTKEERKIELALQKLALSGELKPIGNSALLSPSASFTALFMIKHAQRHFIQEGIQLRHVLDWVFFLQHQRENVDWSIINKFYKDFRLQNFVSVMTAYCIERLGIDKSLFECVELAPVSSSELTAFEEYLFAEHHHDGEAHWWQKIPRLMSRFARTWSFRKYLHIPFWKYVMITFTFASYWHRKPILE